MDDELWDRHCYVMDKADRDKFFCDARDGYNELRKQFYAYLDSQPDNVQEMLIGYVWNFMRMNLRLFNLACECLCLPESSEDCHGPDGPRNDIK